MRPRWSELSVRLKEMIPERQTLIFNGINGATGTYLLPEMTPNELFSIARGQRVQKEHLSDLKLRQRLSTQKMRAVKEGVDPLQLSQAGWGVIFAYQDRENIPALKEALGALLDLRREQAGERYREFIYRPNESKTAFLARYGAGPGPADPQKVPYYLLIAASPETIPYAFQYQLDVQYAVGRIHFENIAAYAHYAHRVVGAERSEHPLPRRALFFGVQNEADRATQLSTAHLVKPLHEELSREAGLAGWRIDSIIGEGATKTALADSLVGDQAPALIFSASHGMGFPKGDLRQLPHQGALLCQDWPGPYAWRGPIPEAHYLSADDIASNASPARGLAFHYACYGAGTPEMDEFSQGAFSAPAPIASQAFIARLPQRLLGHPKGGMLAVIGHVERAWGYSFLWQNAGGQLAVFESALKRLMAGYPVGYAMEYFNERYAELSTALSSELEGIRFGKRVNEFELAGMWTANNDARSYVILGDPAVRLRVVPQEPVPAGEGRESAAPLRAGAASGGQSVAGMEALDKLGKELGQISSLEVDARMEPRDRCERLVQLGDAFAGLPSGDRVEQLQTALFFYRAALQDLEPDNHAILRGKIQDRLGRLLAELYAWTGDDQYFEQAQEAFGLALEGFAKHPERVQRAAIRYELGDLYARQALQNKDARLARQALESFQKALDVISSSRQSYLWASIHTRLADLKLYMLAEGGNETYRSEAVEHLRSALQVFTPELFPLQNAEIRGKLAEVEGTG